MLTHPENLISFWKHYVKKLNFNPVPLKKQENKINTFLRDFEGKSRLTFTSTRHLKYVVVIKNHSASVYTFSALLMASGVLRLIEDEANVANYYSLPTNFMYPTLDCQKNIKWKQNMYLHLDRHKSKFKDRKYCSEKRSIIFGNTLVL